MFNVIKSSLNDRGRVTNYKQVHSHHPHLSTHRCFFYFYNGFIKFLFFFFCIICFSYDVKYVIIIIAFDGVYNMCVEYVLKEIRSRNQVFFACQSIHFIDIYTLFVNKIYCAPPQNTDTSYLQQHTRHYDINNETKNTRKPTKLQFGCKNTNSLLICFMIYFIFQNYFALFFYLEH